MFESLRLRDELERLRELHPKLQAAARKYGYPASHSRALACGVVIFTAQRKLDYLENIECVSHDEGC